jgi:hypothetical protein
MSPEAAIGFTFPIFTIPVRIDDAPATGKALPTACA